MLLFLSILAFIFFTLFQTFFQWLFMYTNFCLELVPVSFKLKYLSWHFSWLWDLSPAFNANIKRITSKIVSNLRVSCNNYLDFMFGLGQKLCNLGCRDVLDRFFCFDPNRTVCRNLNHYDRRKLQIKIFQTTLVLIFWLLLF